jgi:NTE family protein
MSPLIRASIAVFLAAGLSGCATAVFNSPSNVALSPSTPDDMGAPSDLMRENSIVLSFSGGGLRAAAFAHGVLQALASVKTPEGSLLDDVAQITSVSGSSLTAAHYGVYGREGLARFRAEALERGFEDGMRLSLLSPANLMRMIGGGLNAREDFGDVLDRRVFHGATFADIFRRGRPAIRIQATDLYHRVPFPYLPQLFLVLCSDLSRYSVADAVAASMAAPLVFAPVVIKPYHEQCRPLPPYVANFHVRPEAPRSLNAIARAIEAYRDPNRVRYIKLGDGGLTDNFAVSTLTMSRLIYGTPYAPLTAHDAVTIRRLLFVAVDASRGPHGDWVMEQQGPTGLDLALSATDAAVDSAARSSADAFAAMIHEWEQAVIKYRCRLTAADRARLGAPANWDCADVKFSLAYLSIDQLDEPWREKIDAIPTRLTLEPAQVDDAIEGGKRGMLSLSQLRAYVEGRVRP